MTRRHFLPSFLLAAASALPALAETSAFDGRWLSLSCEVRPQQGQKGLEPWFLKRDITFSEGTIHAVFHSFADRDCAMPLWDLEFAGRFEDKDTSPVAPEARQVDLIIDKSVKFTPLMEGFAQFLNSGGPGSCGAEAFTVGLQQEVRETGCAAIGLPAKAVTTEFETMLVKGDALFFGARPIDGSSPNQPELRPTALQVPLFRQ
jgi:hypothetical protein